MWRARSLSAPFTDTLIRELAAAAAASSTANPTPIAASTVTSPTSEQLQAKKEEAVASAPADNSWSNTFGLWAWKKEVKEPAPVAKSVEEVKGKP
jgi:CCR4-NOT transcriptional regulation complex NOT5 subunit